MGEENQNPNFNGSSDGSRVNPTCAHSHPYYCRPLLLQVPLVYHHGYLTNFPGYFITIEMLTPLWSDQLRKSAPTSTSTRTLTQPLVIFCQAVSIRRLHSKILMEHSGSAIIDVIYRITPTWIEARVMVVRELNGVASVLVSPSFCVSLILIPCTCLWKRNLGQCIVLVVMIWKSTLASRFSNLHILFPVKDI